MKNLTLLLVFFSLGLTSFAHAKETPHLQFVSEYIRQLGTIEHVRAAAESELKESKESGGNQLSDCIRSCTRFQLELKSQIGMLATMSLNPPFEDLIKSITAFEQQKLELYKDLSDICSTLIAGPKPNIDYGKLAAEMPKITAQLEYIDESFFTLSTMVFATLIDPKPDSQNHCSHLIITRAEREKLIHSITLQFGEKLDQKNQNNIVGAASVLTEV